MNVNQPFVNEAVSQEMLFQNQTPANVGQVYGIVVNAMNQMQIPYSQQTLDYVMNAITPIIQNAQWQTAQAQENTVALMNIVKDLLTRYQSEIMQNARLKKEKQSAIRYFFMDEANVGWCREGTKETKIGCFKIHSVMDIKIGKDETYRDYKYVEYEDSQAQIQKCLIPLNKIAAKTLVSCFNGFSYICSSKQIANDFLAWCIKNYANPKQITIPEYPGFTLKEVNGQRQIDFNANDGEHDNSLLERCSEHFKKKILLSGKLLPEDISAAAANYLNTPEKVVLFVNGICGVLSTVLLDIQEPISQILTVAVPSNDYIKPACCYLQTYNKGKNALSFDDNITAIRKLIRSAKDETAVLTDCIHADNTIRREEVIRELLVLNTNAECKPHNLAVISTCGQYLIPSKQKICLTLSEDFEHAMSYEAEQKMCLSLSLLTRFIIHVACQDYERFRSNLKNSIAAYHAAASQYDLLCPESETSFAVMAAVTDMLNKNQALPVRIQEVHKLLLEILQVSAEVEGDASDAVADEFVKVLNNKLRTDQIDMLLQSKDMDFISGKAQVIVKDDLLLMEESTITDVILPEMQTTDSVHRILSALSEADLLFATKKNRYPSTVYCKGQSSRVSFIAVKMDDILDQDVKQKFETQACAEWFRTADGCPSMIPLVKNELGLTAVRKFDFESQENLHCFVTGKSGSGKTHFMTEYIVSLQQAGQKVVILDTSDSFTKSAIWKNLSVCGGSQALSAAEDYVEQHFTFHQIENDGIPVEILALDYPSAEITKRKIIYSILTANIANVGKKQRAELNRCIEQLLCSSQPSVVGFGDVLESEDVSDSISMQFEDILAPFIEYKQNEDTWGEFLQKTNDIVVISSAALSGSGGSAMVDMLLMSLFYYQRNNPESHLAIVIDEIQNQNCGGSSPIAQVLKEGRKYHMSLTYATQSLSDKNKDTMKTMNNADMRIYMKPDETSARSIARSLDIPASELTQMQKGECYVNGTIYNNLMQSNESGLIHGYTYRHFITE